MAPLFSIVNPNKLCVNVISEITLICANLINTSKVTNGKEVGATFWPTMCI